LHALAFQFSQTHHSQVGYNDALATGLQSPAEWVSKFPRGLLLVEDDQIKINDAYNPTLYRDTTEPVLFGEEFEQRVTAYQEWLERTHITPPTGEEEVSFDEFHRLKLKSSTRPATIVAGGGSRTAATTHSGRRKRFVGKKAPRSPEPSRREQIARDAEYAAKLEEGAELSRQEMREQIAADEELAQAIALSYGDETTGYTGD
jgi:hypothetical protein